MFYQSIKHKKLCFIVLHILNLYFKAHKEAKAIYYTVIKHSGYLRTLEKYRKHSPACSLCFLNFSHVLKFLLRFMTVYKHGFGFFILLNTWLSC